MPDLRIEKLVATGQGLARGADGKVVFVKGALPGELVEAEIMQEKKDFSNACVTRILEQSPDRAVPVCPYFGICGGCSLMHLAPEKETQYKQRIVEEIFRREKIETDGLFAEPCEGPALGYRTRVRFSVSGNTVGFQKSSSNEIVRVENCPVLDPRINLLLKTPKLLANSSREGQCPVILCDSGPLLGSGTSTVTVKGHVFPVSNAVFFQSNLSLLPALIDFVLENIPDGASVMDLYSGIGTFAAFTEQEHDTLAVERDKKCISLAKKHLKSAKFFTSAVEDFSFRKLHADCVIVDPPRVGLQKNVPALISSVNPKTVIYVSCDPVTQARDIKKFELLGFKPVRARLFNLYQRTSHMETVVLLNNPNYEKNHVSVDVDMNEYRRIKDRQKTTK